MATPLNVLLITLDQWRADALSAAGHPLVRTPHIDALAADGVRFARHYVQAAPCGPSRASLLTGLYLHTHRSVRNGTPLDARFTNIALEARRAGHEPALVGYTDTKLDPRRRPDADPATANFEQVLPGFTPVSVPYDRQMGWRQHLVRRGYDVPPGRGYDIFRQAEGHPGAAAFYRAEDSDTAFHTDEAIGWLATREASEPWLLHLSYLRPHWPHVAPAPYNAMYDPADVPLPVRAATPAEEARQHPWLDWMINDVKREAYYVEGYTDRRDGADRDLARMRAVYYGLVSEVDDNLGRLFAWLKDRGLWETTLTVLTADHGEMLGDHWLFGKDGFFDEAFHVPLVVRDPRQAADGARGQVVSRFTEAVDVMPTVLAAIGTEVPHACQGHDLAPFLKGEDPEGWRRAAHWEFDFRDVRWGRPERALDIPMEACNLAVLRDEERQYTHFAGLPALYHDLGADPDQFENLAADPTRAGEVLAAAQILLDWRMRTDDRALTGMTVTKEGVVERSREQLHQH